MLIFYWGWIKIFFYFFIYSGRSFPFPINGFLFLLWIVSSLGLFLSNHSHWMVFWRRPILRLCRTNDRTQAWFILVFMLEIFRSSSHVCRFCLLRYILWTRYLWKRLRISKMGRNDGPVHEFCLYDVGTHLCHLLCFNSTWNDCRGMCFVYSIFLLLIILVFVCILLSRILTANLMLITSLYLTNVSLCTIMHENV